MRQIIKDVVQWGIDKGILQAVDLGFSKKCFVNTKWPQYLKTLEEVQELGQAIDNDDKTEVIDAIGDIQVTLILQCKLWGIDYDKCLEEAYKVIKNRTGKMVNGTFVKDKTCDDCAEDFYSKGAV